MFRKSLEAERFLKAPFARKKKEKGLRRNFLLSVFLLLVLIFSFSLFSFLLSRKAKEISKLLSEIQSLESQLREKKEENSELNNKNLKLKEDLINDQRKGEKLKKEIYDLKDKIKQFQERIKEKDSEFGKIKSRIIRTPSELDYFYDLTFGYSEYPLIYRATSDGDNYINFQKKVKGKSPIIVLIRTINGNIFGGYTEQKLDNEADISFKSDLSAFVFNLKEKKKYPIREESSYKAVELNKNKFILKFGEDLVINDNFLTTKSTSNFPSDYQCKDCLNHQLTGGEKEFMIAEVEVYHLV